MRWRVASHFLPCPLNEDNYGSCRENSSLKGPIRLVFTSAHIFQIKKADTGPSTSLGEGLCVKQRRAKADFTLLLLLSGKGGGSGGHMTAPPHQSQGNNTSEAEQQRPVSHEPDWTSIHQRDGRRRSCRLLTDG